MNYLNENLSLKSKNHSGDTSSKARRTIRAPKADAGVADLLAHLRKELTIPFGEIVDLASQLESISIDRQEVSSLADQRLYNKLAVTSRKAADFIRNLSDLSDLWVDESMPGVERLLLVDLVSRVAGEFKEISLERGVGLRLEDCCTQLEPVYGSLHWIRVVFQQLISNMIISSPTGSYVLFRIRQVGGYQLVSGTLHHGRPLEASRDLTWHEYLNRDTTFSSATSGKQLYLSIIHAVIELHGGMFNVGCAEDGSVNSFKFILPTGVPRRLKRRVKCPVSPVSQ